MNLGHGQVVSNDWWLRLKNNPVVLCVALNKATPHQCFQTWSGMDDLHHNNILCHMTAVPGRPAGFPLFLFFTHSHCHTSFLVDPPIHAFTCWTTPSMCLVVGGRGAFLFSPCSTQAHTSVVWFCSPSAQCPAHTMSWAHSRLNGGFEINSFFAMACWNGTLSIHCSEAASCLPHEPFFFWFFDGPVPLLCPHFGNTFWWHFVCPRHRAWTVWPLIDRFSVVHVITASVTGAMAVGNGHTCVLGVIFGATLDLSQISTESLRTVAQEWSVQCDQQDDLLHTLLLFCIKVIHFGCSPLQSFCFTIAWVVLHTWCESTEGCTQETQTVGCTSLTLSKAVCSAVHFFLICNWLWKPRPMTALFSGWEHSVIWQSKIGAASPHNHLVHCPDMCVPQNQLWSTHTLKSKFSMDLSQPRSASRTTVVWQESLMTLWIQTLTLSVHCFCMGHQVESVSSNHEQMRQEWNLFTTGCVPLHNNFDTARHSENFEVVFFVLMPMCRRKASTLRYCFAGQSYCRSYITVVTVM